MLEAKNQHWQASRQESEGCSRLLRLVNATPLERHSLNIIYIMRIQSFTRADQTSGYATPAATAEKPSSTILELLNRPIPFPAMAITTCLRALGWL